MNIFSLNLIYSNIVLIILGGPGAQGPGPWPKKSARTDGPGRFFWARARAHGPLGPPNKRKYDVILIYFNIFQYILIYVDFCLYILIIVKYILIYFSYILYYNIISLGAQGPRARPPKKRKDGRPGALFLGPGPGPSALGPQIT